MKIDKTTPPLPASQIGEVAPRSTNATPTGGTASGDTSVRLGTGSAQLRSMQSSLDNTSVVDKEKVATIKQAISEGRFQLNSGVIADRLIDSAKELISAHKAGSA